MINEKILVPAIFALFIVLEAITGRFLQKEKGSTRDIVIEAASSLTIVLITVPLIFAVAPLLVEAVRPGSADALAGLPWWAMLAILLVADDMTQYWWHRASHTFPVLYNLHRAHHSGGYLSIRTAYRNNLFYYLFMPGLWIAAVLVHLGFYPVYAVYLVVKMTVIFGAHSAWRWDEALYKVPAFAPVMWVLERVISTPATHSAHHGLHKEDGVTHYKGNYGNLLFFWDVLFGTAKITRRYPETYGIEGMEPVSAGRELLWPLVRK